MLRVPSATRPGFCYPDSWTTEIYPLSLHDALPISPAASTTTGRRTPVSVPSEETAVAGRRMTIAWSGSRDRKSTRLNSSHTVSSYAVFCLKKKNKHQHQLTAQAALGA